MTVVIALSGKLRQVKDENGYLSAEVTLIQTVPEAKHPAHHVGRVEVRITREQALDLMGRDPAQDNIRADLTIEVIPRTTHATAVAQGAKEK